MDDPQFSILYLLQEGERSIRGLSSQVGVPMSTMYRKIKELETRGWIRVSGKNVSLTEKAVFLLHQRFELVVGVIHVEHQMLDKLLLKHHSHESWEHHLRTLVEISESEGLDYGVAAETAAYLYTGYQTPSACFAYIRKTDGDAWSESFLKRGYAEAPEGEMADIVLFLVRSIPRTSDVNKVRCVSKKRAFLEGLSTMGRGLLDSIVLSKILGEKIFLTVPEELTDVVA
nr:helix-turn-helix domain-containing protein [Candidatus Freyarchaeota archaeon]